MRRWVITVALLSNALASGLVLFTLWYDTGWGQAPRLSATTAQVMIVAAAAAFALTLLLVPLLGISFWARDRGTRRLEAELAESRDTPRPGGPRASPAPRTVRRSPASTDDAST